MLVSPSIRIATEDRHPELNASQFRAVDEIFLSREEIVGLDEVAGGSKTRRWQSCARVGRELDIPWRVLRPHGGPRRSSLRP